MRTGTVQELPVTFNWLNEVGVVHE